LEERYFKMKKTPFKTKNSTLKAFKRMRNFREVTGEIKDVWQVQEADHRFSLEIRKRDSQCVACGSTRFLGCSHYFGRTIYATRYDPENCITLCTECHAIWEINKKGIYKDYMLMWLGEKEFQALEERSREKVSPYYAITEFMKLNKKLVEGRENEIQY